MNVNTTIRIPGLLKEKIMLNLESLYEPWAVSEQGVRVRSQRILDRATAEIDTTTPEGDAARYVLESVAHHVTYPDSAQSFRSIAALNRVRRRKSER